VDKGFKEEVYEMAKKGNKVDLNNSYDLFLIIILCPLLIISFTSSQINT
jgi:hypothetical protein